MPTAVHPNCILDPRDLKSQKSVKVGFRAPPLMGGRVGPRHKRGRSSRRVSSIPWFRSGPAALTSTMRHEDVIGRARSSKIADAAPED
jgi:hypothetical protein